MEAIETVEKTLLKIDRYELEQSKKRAKQAEKDLNNLIKTIETELKRTLEPGEALEVKDNALEWLENNLTFILPNAPEKMRYDALGIDIWVIQQAWKERTWGANKRGKEWEFSFKDGSFHLNENQPIYETHYKYATSKQLEVLENTQTLADALNTAAKQGLNVVRTYAGGSVAPMHKLKDLFPVVRYKEKQGEFVPDLEAIARIK